MEKKYLFILLGVTTASLIIFGILIAVAYDKGTNDAKERIDANRLATEHDQNIANTVTLQILQGFWKQAYDQNGTISIPFPNDKNKLQNVDFVPQAQYQSLYNECVSVIKQLQDKNGGY